MYCDVSMFIEWRAEGEACQQFGWFLLAAMKANVGVAEGWRER